MIDLNSFFTLPTGTTPQIGAGQGGLNPELAALKLLALQNAEASEKDDEKATTIFDLLLQLSDDETGEFITTDTKGLLQSENAAFEEKAKLDLIKILAGNDSIAEEVAHLDKIADLNLTEEVQQTLALNQQVFDNIIRAGTGNADLEIDKETGEIIVPYVAKTLNIIDNKSALFSRNISELIGKIESLTQKADPALLNTLDITPAEITNIQEIALQIKNGEQPSPEDLKVIENVLAGFVALVPPPVKSEIIIPQQSLKNSGKPASLELAQNSITSNDLAARLNNLVSNSNETSTIPLPFGADEAEGDVDFELVLKNASRKQYAGNPLVAEDLGAKAANSNTAPPATPNILQAWPFGGNGTLFGSATFNDQIAEQLGLSLNGQQSAAQGSLTSLVNQAHAAHHPHPATQTVAATIAKAGMNGQDTDISLRLDPPDLGRVDVRMTFGKDKIVKAVVTAEKPETFMMLQRDAQILERALQEIGLDTDGGLSFELAEHGLDFDQHNQRGGNHENGRTGGIAGDDGEEMEIIQSTMTWHVDPESGHTRYNILA